ncbi:MAG: hypothetical protein CK424_07300 [Legionella sp.]|nr:MAG: hypothetical protein CK424_07300 [Legionella sp.]
MNNTQKIAILLMSWGFSCFCYSANTETYAVSSVIEKDVVKKNGLYVGVGLGGVGLQQNSNGNLSSSSGGLIAQKSESLHTGGAGLNSTLQVGYGWYLPNRLFLGAEIFGNLTNTSSFISATEVINQNRLSYSTTSTLQSMYGIRALPGYQVISQAAVYGIVGYVRSHLKNSNGNGLISNGTFSINFPSSSSSLNLNGYQLGVGSLIDITEHLSLRGDVIYAGYQNRNEGPVTVISPDGQTRSAYAGYSQHTVEGDIGLVYKFN